VAIYFRERAPEQARQIVLEMSDPELREKALEELGKQTKHEGG
jgi:hypothetical protein